MGNAAALLDFRRSREEQRGARESRLRPTQVEHARALKLHPERDADARLALDAWQVRILGERAAFRSGLEAHGKRIATQRHADDRERALGIRQDTAPGCGDPDTLQRFSVGVHDGPRQDRR